MTIFCPSMMCADFSNLKEEIKNLENAEIDMFHCDVMDGSFVPNMTLGIKDIETIRKNTDALIDCHLMIENPSSKVDWFIDAGVDLIYIHPEAERYTGKTLTYIKDKGKLAGIAINPDTSIESIKEILHYLDYILVMTVNPGFAGQKFIESTKEKIKKLVELKEEYDYKIIIDGACSPEVIEELSYLGCDGFVLGTSALFGKNESYDVLMKKLRNI